MTIWHKAGFKGVRFREHLTRKHGLKPDRYFTIRYKIAGKTKEEALGWASEGMTATKAYEHLSKLKEAARTGVGEIGLREKRAKAAASRKHEAEKPTLYMVLEKYKVSLRGKPSLKTDLYYQKYFMPTLGEMKPEDLRTAHITELRQRVESAGKAPATVKHVLCLLRSIIRFGAHEGLYDMPNVSKLRFKMPEIDNEKTECLTAEQATALFKALDNDSDQNLANLMRLALATGMRRGALLGLQWHDLDFKQGYITLRGEVAKSGKTSTIPMTAAARAILKQIRPAGSLYVFPCTNAKTEMRNFQNRIRKAANLPEDFRMLHGLRHTYASWLASSGKVDLFTLQRLLTHSSPQMTQRYAHLADEAVKRAASVIDECLDIAANAEPASPQGAKIISFTKDQ